MNLSLMQRHGAAGLFALGFLILVGCQSRPANPSERETQTRTTLPDSVLTPADSAAAERFDRAMDQAFSSKGKTESIGSLMQEIGLHFRGRPYMAGTLDEPSSETLVVRFDGFDCVTFVETVLGLARGAVANDSTYAGFARRLAEQRYRNGQLDGYCSRLHYFTEWLADNDERGLVRRLGETLGGRVLDDSLNFMSTHRSAYNRFATNDSLFACIQRMEADLYEQQQREPVRFVHQDSIRAVYDQLRAGDIVALVSSVDGLDVAHTGLVYAHENGERGLLHASLSDGVVVSPDLQRYVQKIEQQIGMVVARPQPVP